MSGPGHHAPPRARRMPIHAPGTPYLVQAVSTTVRTVRRTRPVAGQTYVCTYLYALRL
jgi:hypothetical protein